jgi:hypothetical protein
VCRILAGRPERKRPLGKVRRRWDNIIKIYLPGVGRRDMVWIDLAQDKDMCKATVNAVMNLWVPIKCGDFLD